MGTGIAIVWYTFETLELRRETSKLQHETAIQSGLAVEQIKIQADQIGIAREQMEAAIRPLLVSRIEAVQEVGSIAFDRFVIRNIGHGPALFIKVDVFTVDIPNLGLRRVRLFPVDLIEPNDIGVPQVEFFLAGVQIEGPLPSYGAFLDSLTPEPSGHASARHEITITYADVQKRLFQSVMEMGLEGAKLLKYERL